MKQRVNILGEDLIGRLLLNSMSDRNVVNLIQEYMPERTEEEKKNPRNVPVILECKINGVEVDLVHGLKFWSDQIENMIERRASKKALDMIRGAGLYDVVDIMNSVKWQIIDKLEKAGYKVNEDDRY